MIRELPIGNTEKLPEGAKRTSPRATRKLPHSDKGKLPIGDRGKLPIGDGGKLPIDAEMGRRQGLRKKGKVPGEEKAKVTKEVPNNNHFSKKNLPNFQIFRDGDEIFHQKTPQIW